MIMLANNDILRYSKLVNVIFFMGDKNMNFYKSEQSGRSMVEMLGVLAIIGVLSVGGIAGYSKAMAKFKLSKAMDQVSMLVANIRTLYSGQRSYSGLNNKNAISFGVVPSEMASGTSTITNAFSSNVTVTAAGTDDLHFTVKFEGLGKEACVSMTTADWGSGSGSGLVGIAPSSTATAGTQVTGSNLPVSLTTAASACDCAASTCSITWEYY